MRSIFDWEKKSLSEPLKTEMPPKYSINYKEKPLPQLPNDASYERTLRELERIKAIKRGPPPPIPVKRGPPPPIPVKAYDALAELEQIQMPRKVRQPEKNLERRTKKNRLKNRIKQMSNMYKIVKGQRKTSDKKAQEILNDYIISNSGPVEYFPVDYVPVNLPAKSLQPKYIDPGQKYIDFLNEPIKLFDPKMYSKKDLDDLVYEEFIKHTGARKYFQIRSADNPREVQNMIDLDIKLTTFIEDQFDLYDSFNIRPKASYLTEICKYAKSIGLELYLC